MRKAGEICEALGADSIELISIVLNDMSLGRVTHRHVITLNTFPHIHGWKLGRYGELLSQSRNELRSAQVSQFPYHPCCLATVGDVREGANLS